MQGEAAVENHENDSNRKTIGREKRERKKVVVQPGRKILCPFVPYFVTFEVKISTPRALEFSAKNTEGKQLTF
jgi:hypothetical protein